jgi:hypothetical protein
MRALRIRHRVNVNTLEQEDATRLEMNEIALVEFEANVSLFFDAYSEDRTTGSFILIDPLSNATVGAGMIQEDSAAEASFETREDQFSSRGHAPTPEIQVAPRERYERHGHYPAILLLEDRPELATRVERALFEKGFEVMHFNALGIAAAAVIEIARVAKAAGFVAIYSTGVLAAETKQILASESEDRVFDAAGTDLSTDDELFQRVMAFAWSLLLEAPKENRKRVN